MERLMIYTWLISNKMHHFFHQIQIDVAVGAMKSKTVFLNYTVAP